MAHEEGTTQPADAGPVERGVGLQPNGLDARAVDPRNGAKYSPNLHRWLTMRSKRNRLVAERGRHSMMVTTSPIFASFFSSCAWNFFDWMTRLL